MFEKPDHPGSSAIDFQASGEAFLSWKAHLEAHGLELRLADHQLAFSLYFGDPDNNLHEITTYDHEFVSRRLADLQLRVARPDRSIAANDHADRGEKIFAKTNSCCEEKVR